MPDFVNTKNIFFASVSPSQIEKRTGNAANKLLILSCYILFGEMMLF